MKTEYKALITVKDNGKENEIHLDFVKDDMITAMEMIEGILRFSTGEVSVFVRRV